MLPLHWRRRDDGLSEFTLITAARTAENVGDPLLVVFWIPPRLYLMNRLLKAAMTSRLSEIPFSEWRQRRCGCLKTWHDEQQVIAEFTEWRLAESLMEVTAPAGVPFRRTFEVMPRQTAGRRNYGTRKRRRRRTCWQCFAMNWRCLRRMTTRGCGSVRFR
jgi:hypothetical protein